MPYSRGSGTTSTKRARTQGRTTPYSSKGRAVQPYGRRAFATARAVGETAMTALKIARDVKKMLNVEVKNKDVPRSANTSFDTLGCALISGLNQGTGSESRNGEQIKLQSVQLQGSVVHNAAGDDSQIVRLMLVRYNAMNGVGPVATDLLSEDNVDGFREMDTSGRYHVLWDQKFVVSADSPMLLFDEYIKTSAHIKYIGSTDATADQGAGALFFCNVSTQTTANYPVINWASRIRYVDN